MRLIGTLFNLFSNNVDFLSKTWIWLNSGLNSSTQIDLIHAHTDGIGLRGYNTRNAFYVSKWLKKPLVLSFHQKIGMQQGDLLPRIKLFKKVFDCSSQIIVHRKVNLQYLKEWGYGCKTHFISIPINLRRFQKPASYQQRSEKLRLLYVGRLDHRRGILPLIEAFSLAHNVNANIVLNVIGYGALENQARSLCQRLDIKDAVFFHGKQLDVRKHLWSSDVFVSLNISDNYPSLALREAMATGLDPIVTDVGETREIITHNVNGLIVAPTSPKATSTAILTLAKDQKLLRQLSTNARLSSKSFDVKQNLKLFVDVYKKAIRD